MAHRQAVRFALALALFAGALRADSQAVALPDGASVAPPTASSATGRAILTHASAAHTLAVDYTFSGLVGSSTAAHIHCCVAPPGNVGVALFLLGFPTGVAAGSYQTMHDLTNAGIYAATFLAAAGGTAANAEAALVAGMQAGNAYVCLHTTVYPGSEIRGFAFPTIFADGFESGLTTAWDGTVP